MANVNHSALSDPYLHEPKGASTATAGDVYVADGAGSGSWEDHRRSVVNLHIHDISVAGNMYVPIPFGGTVSRVSSVIAGALTGADVVLTIKNSSAATMGTITITQAGSAAGNVDFTNPSTNNTITDNDYILVQGNGGASSHVDCVVSIVVEHT